MPLTVDLAIPDNFVVKNKINSDSKPNLYDGVIWGSEDAVQAALEIKDEQIFDKLKDIVFSVRISSNVAQISENSFTGEDTIESDLMSIGAKDIKIRKLSWGQFPVLAVSGTCDGRPARFAWVGLNYASNALVIIEYFPSNPKTHEKGIKTWDNLMNHTVEMSKSDIMKAMGYQMEPGKSSLTRARATVTMHSEKVKGQKLSL